MIIKPNPKRYFARIPNELLNDWRLAIETRGMIAYLVAKPPNWILHPEVTMTEIGVGRKKLDRMYGEAMCARYMARSVKQTQGPDGSWGPFEYIVGMPEDVAAALAREPKGKFFCGEPEAHAPEAHTPDGTTDKEIKRYKLNTDKKPPNPLLVEGANQEGLCDRSTQESNKSLRAVPSPAQASHAGIRELTSKPSGHSARLQSIANDHLIQSIMETHQCSREEAAKILSSLPDARKSGEAPR